MHAKSSFTTKIPRRRFIEKSAAASLVFAAVPVFGAEDRARKYRTALVGCGWWGNNILGEAMASGRCRIAALCDVDGRFLNRLDEKWPRKVFSTGGRPVKGPPVLTREEQTSDAPDHQVAVFEFENFTVSWEHRQFAGNNAEKGENVGCYFYGTDGTGRFANGAELKRLLQRGKADPLATVPAGGANG